jgi:hypothetical protein
MKRGKMVGPRKGKGRGARVTTGRDNETNKSSRGEYFVDNALEITPHRAQKLVAKLGPPAVDRRFKYNLIEQQLTASHLSSATGTTLVNISQGATDISRTGDRVRARRLVCGGKISGSASAVSQHVVRVLIFIDVGNTNPAAGSILNSSSSYLPLASYGRDFADLYQIVFDEVVIVPPTTAGAGFSLFRVDRDMEVDMEFNGGGTAPIANGLRVLVMCDATANFATLTMSSTLWFEDLDA